MKYLVDTHFITIFLILGFSMKLLMRKQTRDVQVRYFWLTIICAALSTLASSMEYWAAQSAVRLQWRILFRALEYIFKPVAAMGVAMVVAHGMMRTQLVWVPAAVNAVIMLLAFVTPLSFSFNAKYQFVRGFLGNSVFVVSFYYVYIVIRLTFIKFQQGRSGEANILILCAAVCVLAALIDAQLNGELVIPTILISCVFFYMFLRSQDTNHDSLTRLLTRQSFYEDCVNLEPAVTGVASIDMNGLKVLNDSEGHTAGDQALSTLGRCLLSVASRDILAYRVGGDEFILLFLNGNEAMVRGALDRVLSRVEAASLSVSSGYACREHGEDLQTLINLSDQRMYADKASYYSRPGHNQRTR